MKVNKNKVGRPKGEPTIVASFRMPEKVAKSAIKQIKNLLKKIIKQNENI